MKSITQLQVSHHVYSCINKKNWRVNDHIVKGLFFHKISLPVWNFFLLIWCTTARCLHFLASFGQFFNKVQKTTQHKIKQSKSSCIFLKISKFNPQTSKMWFIYWLCVYTVYQQLHWTTKVRLLLWHQWCQWWRYLQVVLWPCFTVRGKIWGVAAAIGLHWSKKWMIIDCELSDEIWWCWDWKRSSTIIVNSIFKCDC